MAKKAGGGNASDLIRQVIAELDAQINELSEKRTQLARMVSDAPAAPVAGRRRRGRPRGAVAKPAKAAKPAKPAKAGKKKREFSAETKAKLKAAAKARWARFRAEKKAAAKAA